MGLKGRPMFLAGLDNVIAISAGDMHSIALKADTTIAIWGDDYAGEVPLPDGLENIIDVGSGYAHSMVLKEDGTVIAWGWNEYGQGEAPWDLANVIAIAAGSRHNLALIYDPLYWGIFPVRADGYCDTTPWMGWLWVENDPWIWSVSLGKWFYCPGQNVTEGGGWVYVPK